MMLCSPLGYGSPACGNPVVGFQSTALLGTELALLDDAVVLLVGCNALEFAHHCVELFDLPAFFAYLEQFQAYEVIA